MIRLLSPGEPAPDLEARASDGRTYELRTLLADSYVLLLFYPGNDTPG